MCLESPSDPPDCSECSQWSYNESRSLERFSRVEGCCCNRVSERGVDQEEDGEDKNPKGAYSKRKTDQSSTQPSDILLALFFFFFLVLLWCHDNSNRLNQISSL